MMNQVGRPFSATVTLYKEDFAKFRFIRSQPIRTQLVHQFQIFFRQIHALDRSCYLMPSIAALSELWKVEKEDIMDALELLRSRGFQLTYLSGYYGPIYLFPNCEFRGR